MREIKFRGKRVDSGEWVYGWYAPLVCNDRTIIPNIKDSNGSDWKIKEETVSQYTGLKDKNDVEIYDGDIVREKSVHWRTLYKVETEIYAVKCDYLGSIHLVRPILGGEKTTLLTRSSCVEVLGNVYDNPELLEVEE